MKMPVLKGIKNGILGLRRDVIRMMRLKFICVAMGILVVVFLIMLTAINMIMQKVSQSQSMLLLQQIASSSRYDSLRGEDGFEDEPYPAEGLPHDSGRRPGINTAPQPSETEEGTIVHAAMLPDDDIVLLLLDEPGGQEEPGEWEEHGEWNNQQIPGWWGAAPDPNWWSNMPNYGAPGGQQGSGGGQQDSGGGQNSGGSQQDSGGGQQNPWEGNPWGGWGQQPAFDPNWWNNQQPAFDPNWWSQQPAFDPNWWNNQQGNDGNHEQEEPKSTTPAMDQPPATAPATAAPTPPPRTEPPTTAFEAQAVPHASDQQQDTAATREAAVPADAQPVETSAAPAPTTPAATAPPTTTTEETTTTTATTTTVQITTATAPAPPEPREPRMDRWKVPITIDHFAILVDKNGGYLGLRNTEDYTDEEAEEIMQGILARDKTEGMYGWLQFCTAAKNYGTLIVVTDKTSDQGILNNLFRTTVIIGIFMLLILLAILIVLSHWITVPVQQAFKRQKQFVSDAGHELKTPMAVLTTNADILRDEIGENKWLTYMQEQIGRMNQLVGDLLRLARMDNACQEYEYKDFDLSMALAATALPFESTAFEKNKNLEMDIQPDVHYCGSEQHIRQLCAIFIDNAIKYSNENGVIKILLLQRGEHAVIEFYNTGCEISQAETEKIFERFYRGDRARSSSGQSGYGLGLAIAKSIMDVHKIKFQVTCEQGRWIRFLLTL